MKHLAVHLRLDILIILTIVLLPLIVYSQVIFHDFVNIDDPLFVTDNYYIKHGFTKEGIRWAFGFTNVSYWKPLTWLSHMLDCEIFSLNSGGHLFTNLTLHILSSVLLFWWLKSATAASWKSFFVAAFFAVHPMNVESVAWIAERKNVLSTFFFLLTLITYSNYTRQPNRYRYGITIVIYALGLMAKPMLITLPFVLLLADHWPLERLKPGQLKSVHLIVEKFPFLILAAISLFVTLYHLGSDVVSHESVSLKLRILNALVSYFTYISKLVFPQKLSVFYPFPKHVAALKAALSFVGLIGCFIYTLKHFWKKPYLFSGWFWYVGTLVPALGLIQGGLWPETADRFAYIPYIGLFCIVAWGTSDIAATFKLKQSIFVIGAIFVIVILLSLTARQVTYWQNSVTLFRHALDINSENHIAHNNLGSALEKDGKIDEASFHYIEALRILPAYANAHNNLGNILYQNGHITDARKHFETALRLRPDLAEAHNNIANMLLDQGDISAAIGHYRKALIKNPNYAKALTNLGSAYLKRGDIPRAIDTYTRAVKIKPELWEAHLNLANALIKNNDYATAIDHCQNALMLKPGQAEIHLVLGRVLYENNDPVIADTHFTEAIRLNPDMLDAYLYRAKIYSMQKKYSEAIDIYLAITKKWPDLKAAYYNLACLYAKINHVPRAVKMLKIAIEKGYDNWKLIKNDPDLHPLRNNDGYIELLTKEPYHDGE